MRVDGSRTLRQRFALSSISNTRFGRRGGALLILSRRSHTLRRMALINRIVNRVSLAGNDQNLSRGVGRTRKITVSTSNGVCVIDRPGHFCHFAPRSSRWRTNVLRLFIVGLLAAGVAGGIGRTFIRTSHEALFFRRHTFQSTNSSLECKFEPLPLCTCITHRSNKEVIFV